MLPQRIVSLVPSQTELLYDLGLVREVVGITKFCIHPDAWFRTKTRVGGTKQVKMEIIHQLKPDLVIANKEENVKEQVEEIAKSYPVWISDINHLSDAEHMILTIGRMTGKEEKAISVVTDIQSAFSKLSLKNHMRKACYLIWQNPYMTIGSDTFIHDMMNRAGFENVFKHSLRYPETSLEEIRTLQPDAILLSSEPFPFKQKHADELQSQLPGTKVMLVDGEMFSWYGSRLLKAPAYFEKLAGQCENV